MKKNIIYILLAVLVAVSVVTGCNNTTEGNNTETTTEDVSANGGDSIDTQNIEERLSEAEDKIAELQAKASPMNDRGEMSEDEYMTLSGYGQSLDIIKTHFAEDLNEEKVKLIDNELKELESDLEEYGEMLAQKQGNPNEEMKVSLEKLTLGIKELKSLADEKFAEGNITEEKCQEIVKANSTVQEYIKKLDGELSDEQLDEIENDIGAIKGQMVGIASEVGGDNALIDKILGVE